MKRLYLSVVQNIIEQIESGKYPAGGRLPGERELADIFGVSRVTIREAQIALEAKGYIVKSRSGAMVSERDKGSDGALPDMSAFELTAARAIIESEAAALAAINISEEDLEELRLITQAMVTAATDTPAEGEAADKAFHLAIARQSGNTAIEYMVKTLWRIRNEVPKVSKVYARVCESDTDARTEEHAAILDALYSRDSAAARSTMRAHFQRLFEEMLTVTENDALEEVRLEMQANRQRFLGAAYS